MSFSEFIERQRDLHRPNKYELKKYLINDGKRHPFAVICPGGGYGAVCSFVEGRPFAERLNEMGFHAFVVYYSVKEKARYPQPHEDLKCAIEEIFANAEPWRLDTEGFSIWGSSAGGHLVASYCTENWGTPKPAAIVLIYPVITMGENTHKGSRDNLLGKNPGRDMTERLSVELNVNSAYPPTFAWYGTADDTVGTVNTKMLADALKTHSVPHRIEEYEGIGHGAGLAKGTVAEGWFSSAVSFWQEQRKK